MDMTSIDPVRDELIKKDQHFRDLVHQHDDYEKRLNELAHLTYPSDDEQLEEATLKKKKIFLKDEIYSMLHEQEGSH